MCKVQHAVEIIVTIVNTGCCETSKLLDHFVNKVSFIFKQVRTMSSNLWKISLAVLLYYSSFCGTTGTLFWTYAKQWIRGNLVNFFCEPKSVSKQDALILITCLSKMVQRSEIVISELSTFP